MAVGLLKGSERDAEASWYAFPRITWERENEKKITRAPLVPMLWRGNVFSDVVRHMTLERLGMRGLGGLVVLWVGLGVHFENLAVAGVFFKIVLPWVGRFYDLARGQGRGD